MKDNYIEFLVIKKLLYLSFFLFFFTQIFIINAFDDWEQKYTDMSVPSNAFPGGDSRNIQKAAFCFTYGHNYYSDNECFRDNSLITNFYANGQSTPAYNYPPIVANMYGLFNNFSEKFFQDFWMFNTIFFLFAILIYSYKVNYLLLPTIIFSPVALLLMERGNIDATTFAILFTPLLLTSSMFLHVIFIGLASSIKLFPLIGYFSIYKKKFADSRKFFLGILLLLPLICSSFLSIKYSIASTSYGFGAAFGLVSLSYAPFFKSHLILTYSLIVLYLIASSIIVFLISKNPKLIDPLMSNIKQMDNQRLRILLMSLIIYVSIFLLLVNWGYRFIFIIPAYLILSNFRDFISKVTFWLIFLIFWIPWLPDGWVYFNLLNYALFPLMLIIFIHSYKYYFFR